MSANMLDVNFPPGAHSYKEPLLNVVNHADKILLSRVIYAKFSSPEEAESKLEILRSKGIHGMKLNASILNRQNQNYTSTHVSNHDAVGRTSCVPCKRVAYLDAADINASSIKNFFNAKDVEDKRAVILTFNSEDEAESASQKVMTAGGTQIQLAPFSQSGPSMNDAKRKRELNENADEVQNKKSKHEDNADNAKEWNTLQEFDVSFPPGAQCYKEPLLRVLNSADSASVRRDIIAKFSSREEAEAKLKKLRKVSVGGMFTSASILSKNKNRNDASSPQKAETSNIEADEEEEVDDACKRLAHVGSFDSNPDTVKIFFNAKSVQFHSEKPGNAVLLLTFDTEEEADFASMNVMNLRGKVISLKPFNDQTGKPLNGSKMASSQQRRNCENDDDDSDDDDDDDDDDDSDDNDE